VKKALGFGVLAAVIIFGAAWGITTLRPEPEIVRAVWSSAVLAFVVQLISFAIARQFVATNPIAGFGLGSLLRFGVLILHGVVGVKALSLVQMPALLSLVAFLFVTTLVEPFFLKQ
jgi:hypothetical protein